MLPVVVVAVVVVGLRLLLLLLMVELVTVVVVMIVRKTIHQGLCQQTESLNRMRVWIQIRLAHCTEWLQTDDNYIAPPRCSRL